MPERDLLTHIRSIAAGQPKAFPQVVVPPGDDCAAVRSPGGDLLLLTTDHVVEGRHVAPLGASPDLGRLDAMARKAMARSLSDLAAMAAKPLAALATACLPHRFPPGAARALADSVHKWGVHWKCPVVGGDLASFAPERPGPVVLTVACIGAAHASRGPVLRGSARAGDDLFVTGVIGGSHQADGGGRHQTFEPRLEEAQWLADNLGFGLRAMIDLSDGLGLDGARLAEASKLTAEFRAGAIPLSPGVRDLRKAVGEGEDYELLFAADPTTEVPAHCPTTGTPFTKVGRLRAYDGLHRAELVLGDGTRLDVSESGFLHD